MPTYPYISLGECRKMISQNWVCLVWKLLPDPVGVFCTLLEPPNAHMRQKPFVRRIIILLYISPIYPFKGYGPIYMLGYNGSRSLSPLVKH